MSPLFKFERLDMADSARTVSSSFAVAPELQRPDRVYSVNHQGLYLSRLNTESSIPMQHYIADTDLRSAPRALKGRGVNLANGDVNTFESARHLEEGGRGRQSFFDSSPYTPTYMNSPLWYSSFKEKLFSPKVMYGIAAVTVAGALVGISIAVKK